MRIGYARVSTEDQNLDLQRRALLNAGCDAIYEDQGVSGMARRRPNLDRALATLNPGDMLIVWKLDRLGRSLIHLVETIRGLGEQGVGFLSLSDSIDTTSPTYSSGEGRLAMIGVDAEAVVVRTSLRAQVAAADEPDHDFSGT